MSNPTSTRDRPAVSRGAFGRVPARLALIGDAGPTLLALWPDAPTRASFEDVEALYRSHDLWDAVAWRPSIGGSNASDDRLADDLEQLRARLDDRGRLVVLSPPKLRRELVLSLAAAGFAIVDDRSTGDVGSELIVARPAPLSIRGYRPGDEDSILRLFTPSFLVARSDAHWRWKYRDNPYGRLRITLAVVAARDDLGLEAGTLVAHYAGYPLIFTVHDGRRLVDLPVLQIGDTMTHPAVRALGRGPTSVLARAVAHFYAAYCDDRVAFNLGVNTGNIQRFSRRFVRAERVEPIPHRVREGSAPRSTGRYRVDRIHHVDGRFDRLFRRAAPAYGALVRRDQVHLRWRYLDCPDAPPFVLLGARRFGRLVAWSVFRRHDGHDGDAELRWVDALSLPRYADAATDLLHAALAMPEHRDLARVTAWFPDRPAWWHRQVESLGFRSELEPDDLAWMTVPHRRPDAAALLARAYSTRGDSDLA